MKKIYRAIHLTIFIFLITQNVNAQSNEEMNLPSSPENKVEPKVFHADVEPVEVIAPTLVVPKFQLPPHIEKIKKENEEAEYHRAIPPIIESNTTVTNGNP